MAEGIECPGCGRINHIGSDDFDDEGVLCKCCFACDIMLVFNLDFVKGITVRKHKGVGEDEIDFGEWIKNNRNRVDWIWGSLYDEYT